jgi:hypothetical protein
MMPTPPSCASAIASRDREPRLGDGIHRRRQDRYIERYVPGKLGTHIDLPGQDVGVARLQQNIIECQGFLGDTHEDLRVL